LARKFSGGIVSFGGAEFSGSKVEFLGTEFSRGEARFTGAKFSGGQVGFIGAKFSGGEVDFSHVRAWSPSPVFDFAGRPPDGVVLPRANAADPAAD
jgi:hypothetical protein